MSHFFGTAPLLTCLTGLLLVASAAQAGGNAVHVDDGNASGVEDGSQQNPYRTIQAGVDAALAGDSVLVAAGTYAENVVISDKRIALRGGYAGAPSATYAGSGSGDFSSQNPAANVSRIEAADTAAAVLLEFTAASGSIIDGFTLTGGSRGIELDTAVTFPLIADMVISRNIIEGNGVAEYEHSGGGILLNGPDHEVRDNILRNNVSGRGAGIALFGESIEVHHNVVEDNVGYSDHAGGVYQGGTALIRNNIIRGNRIGEGLGYGWGGGVLVLGTATLRHNIITENSAPSIGGGLFVDDGGTMTVEHELIYGNTANVGAAIYVDGYGEDTSSHAEIIHCTITGNIALESQIGNAVYVELNSTANFRNCVIWNNGGDDFAADGTSAVSASYTLSQEAISGPGNFTADPLFADAPNADFHLRSTAGRYDPEANGGTGGFVIDATHSPAIDAGDPSSQFCFEPAPHGERVNLGAYGNTAEASKSTQPGESEGECVAEGEGEGDEEGTPEGEGEGTPEGEGEGEEEGEGEGEGTVDGEGEDAQTERFRQLLFTFASAETSGDGLLTLGEIQSQLPGFTQDDLDAADANNDGLLSVAELLQEIDGGIVMSADINADFVIALTELLRMIQLYNAGGYFCAATPGDSEDGYRTSPPAGVEPACLLHSIDRNTDKVISLSELLRGIQIYNIGGYSFCGVEQNPEDGFCGNE